MITFLHSVSVQTNIRYHLCFRHQVTKFDVTIWMCINTTAEDNKKKRLKINKINLKTKLIIIE